MVFNLLARGRRGAGSFWFFGERLGEQIILRIGQYCGMNRKAGTIWRVLTCLMAVSGVASAQVLRLGPLDVDADVGVKGVYTTNVEGERPSEATESREDYYFVTSLDLQGHTRLSPGTKINLETGVAYEKHFKRPDLNNSKDPFGKFKLDAETEFRHSTFNGIVDISRNSESKEDMFIPGDKKKRAPYNEFEYGVGWAWAYRALQAGASYNFDRTRYDDEEFQESGDKDETTIDVSFSWALTKRFHLEYTYERKLDDYVYPQGADADDDDWEVKSLIDLRYDLFEKPYLSLYVGYTKDSEETETEEWYPTVGVDFKALLIDTDRWSFDVSAEWKYVEDVPDDSKVTFSADLKNQISRTAEQSLSATQEPVDTFGSNKDTDQTTVAYRFKKSDLFIYNLTLTAGVKWQEDRPTEEDSETERTWTYDVGLNHTRAITRKLRRELRYLYKCEDSNLETELLDEHRVELEFIYSF